MDLSKVPYHQLKDEMERRETARRSVKDTSAYKKVMTWNPVGLWKVTTEGDVEGRSIRQLGTFEGHIADIAFTLAKKCYYSLRFDPVDPATVEVNPDLEANEVGISLDIESGSWDMPGEDRAKAIADMLGKEPSSVSFSVEPSPYYSAVVLKRK